jgi:hypothetical protein
MGINICRMKVIGSTLEAKKINQKVVGGEEGWQSVGRKKYENIQMSAERKE